jgi:DNA-binding transcriptional LysR family regulator
MNLDRLDWALCRSFLAILREGSLSGAARRMGVSHPTVRRHLDELEGALGSPLFVRSPSGLLPTELARDLQATAEAMEVAAEAFVRTASAEKGAVAGTVRITASEVTGAEVLPPILAAVKARHPGLGFELTLTNATEDLLRRDADIAVRMTRPTQADLVARKVGEVTAGLFAHEQWLAQHGPPASLEQLVAAHQLIGYDRDPLLLREMRAMGVKVERTDFGFRSDNDLAQLAALRAGFGVGLCHTALARRQPELRRVLPEIAYPLEIWLVVHASMRSMARVRVAFDALAAELGHYAH